MNSFIGKVNWYDSASKKGSIISQDNIWYRINEFSKISDKDRKNLKTNSKVAFELVNSSIHPIIKNVKIVK